MTIENFPKIQLKTLRNFMLAFCSRIYMSRCASLVMSYYLDINFSGLDNFLSAIPAAINIARMPARIIQSLHFWQKQAQTTIFEHFKILFKVDTQFKMANSGRRPRVKFQNFFRQPIVGYLRTVQATRSTNILPT